LEPEDKKSHFQNPHHPSTIHETSTNMLLEQMPAMVWCLDKEFRITKSVGSGLSAIGLKPNQLLGMTLMEYLGTDDMSTFPLDAHVKALSGKASTYEFELNKRSLHCHVEPLKDTNGEIVGAIGIALDITERKLMEMAMEKTTEELKRSNQELEQFAYAASHDLQEPLHKIIAFGDRLKDLFRDIIPDKGKDYLERMQSAADRMRGLIEDLLQVARVHTRTEPFQNVDLNLVFKDALSDLEFLIKETGGKISCENLPVVFGDSLQIYQMFQNLLSNALKFHYPNKKPKVFVKCQSPKNGFASISISDNGIGIEEEYFERIFKPYQRLHGQEEYEGSGIGLTLCQKIVERHGGKISLESKAGKGTTFTILLPLTLPEGIPNQHGA